MDPLGFALENFDAIGAWRTTGEAGGPVDATGTLPDGAQVEGLKGLRALLVSRRDQFVGAMTEKLLSYAIGRGLEYYDLPGRPRGSSATSASSDYRWSSLDPGRRQERAVPDAAIARPGSATAGRGRGDRPVRSWHSTCFRRRRPSS